MTGWRVTFCALCGRPLSGTAPARIVAAGEPCDCPEPVPGNVQTDTDRR